MKTKKKKLLIVFLILIIGVLACLSVPAVRTLQAKYYLSQKYDAKMSEFKVEDYEGEHYTSVDALFIFNDYYWIDFSYEFSYNGRNFVVRKNDNGWYDDYQLEDLEKWSTEWLQANADSSIRGCYLSTDNILEYYKNSEKEYSDIIKDDEIKNFLVYYLSHCYNGICYYYAPENSISEEDMNEKISSAIEKKIIIYSKNTDKNIEKSIIKHGEWISYIEIQ